MDYQEALKQAWEYAKKCEPPYQFGAVIVKDGKIIAADHNHVAEIPDTSAHAEISAIRKACLELGEYNLKGCVLVATHEPCIMCFSCAMWAEMAKVVYQVPKDAQEDFMYASSMSIEEFNKTALRSSIEIIRIKGIQ